MRSYRISPYRQKHPVEYRAWGAMKTRCFNKKRREYPNYGGRGITVCKRWLDNFPAFYEDMGPRPSPDHSLDRYPNPNGNYEPSNCRWATRKEQLRNTRRALTIEFEGVQKPAAQWAEELGLDYHLVVSRIRTGKTGIDAIDPTKHRHKLQMRPSVCSHCGLIQPSRREAKLHCRGKRKMGRPLKMNRIVRSFIP